MFNDRQRMDTRPLNVPRTLRNHNLTVLTSLQAGKMMPLAAIPLLRADGVRRGGFAATFEMHETEEVLMNPVHMTVSAYLFPFSASERFQGSMDQFNRSYKGQPKVEGGDVEPFFEQMVIPIGGSTDCEILKYLGEHASPSDVVNTFIPEAYNEIWKYRAKNRSPDIELPDRLNMDLLPAFWPASRFAHIVPDYDQAKMEGAIGLTVLNDLTTNRLPVHGIGVAGSSTPQPVSVKNHGRTTDGLGWYTNDTSSTGSIAVLQDPDNLGYADVWAELAGAKVNLSLADLEVAKKTQAFAKLRERYNQHDDEWLIDLLMSGISIPDQAYMAPMFLGQQHTTFQFGKRYSTDAANLDAHVVNGQARVNMTFRTPRLPMGGIVMIVAELVPEQLFERQKNPGLHTTEVSALPDFIRDETDPEKVVEVRNDFIDTDHDTPEGLFGYAPLNHEWAFVGPKIGGRFYRPDVDAVEDTDRKRLWAVETKNPKLAEDFYIVSQLHTKPFLNEDEDPADVVLLGNVQIEGNTVFGPALIEASDDYEKIQEQVPQGRIQKATP